MMIYILYLSQAVIFFSHTFSATLCISFTLLYVLHLLCNLSQYSKDLYSLEFSRRSRFRSRRTARAPTRPAKSIRSKIRLLMRT